MEYSVNEINTEERIAEDVSPADCDRSRRERKGYRILRRLIAHIQLMLSVIVLTCFVIDKFNSSMEFMESTLTKTIVCVFAVFTMVTAIMTIVAYWPKASE